MGWKDAPLVGGAKPKWQDAPLAQGGAPAPASSGFVPVPDYSPGGVQAMRDGLRAAHDAGNLAEERRLSDLLKVVDAPEPLNLGETTLKPVSRDSFYQPGFKPLDEMLAGITSTINQVPVAGPLVEKGAASLQAAAHNALKPDDYPISQSDVLNTNLQREAANPKGTFAGKIVGNAAPYMIASKFALPAKLLGLEGSLFSRIGFGTAAQYGINTADKMTREGADWPRAATAAIVPTLLTAPLALFGSPTRAGRVVTSELKRAGVGADDVQAALDSVGPAAVIGDLSPRLQARLGAVATTPGPGQDAVVNAMRLRAAGANTRIRSGVEDVLGPAPVPSREAAAIRNNQDELQPEYTNVLADASSGDLTRVAQNIENGIMQEKGPARNALEKVRRMLDFSAPAADGLPATAPILDPNPTGWLKARQAIDGMLNGEKDGNVIRVLTDARRQIDEALAAHVPGIKEVDGQFQELARQQEGLDLGATALRNGDAPLHPAEFADEFGAGAVPAGQFIGPSGVPVRIRQGLIADIERIIGTTANNRVAMRQILKGEGSWNRDKLVTAFGEDRADRLIRLFDNEAKMAETEALAFGGSKTENLRSAKADLEPSAGSDGVVRALLNTRFGDAAWKAADRLSFGAASGERRKVNEAIAEALLGKGVQGAGPRDTKRQMLTAVARALIAGQSPY